jgi:hypothetical protein
MDCLLVEKFSLKKSKFCVLSHIVGCGWQAGDGLKGMTYFRGQEDSKKAGKGQNR